MRQPSSAAGSQTALFQPTSHFTPFSFNHRTRVTLQLSDFFAGEETRARSKLLAGEIGASHLHVGIDPVVAALSALFVATTGKTPRFKLDGGSPAENLALQNIQARLRMVVAFLLAQLLPWTRGR